MLTNTLLNLLTKDTFKEKIKSDQGTCLRSLSYKDPCSLCIDQCPSQAIFPLYDGVEIEPVICSGCNLCVSICYTRHFTTRDLSYLKLTASILENKSTSLACIQNHKPGQDHVGCLRAMDKRYLVSYLLSDIDHTIIMDISTCQDCDMCDLDDLSYIQEIQEAHPGLSSKIILQGTREDQIQSRRDFLTSMARLGTSIGASSLEEMQEVLQTLGLQDQASENIDLYTRIFIDHSLDSDIDLSQAYTYIYQVAISKTACTMCKECIHACPNGALIYDKTDRSETISLDQGLCTYCGRCIDTCPESALTKAPLVDLTTKTLVERSLHQCKGCKAITSNLDADGYCSPCAKRRQVSSKMTLR